MVVFAADDVGISEEFKLDQLMTGAELVLHRGVYDRMMNEFNAGNRLAMTIKTTVDAPPGSGLGSSSALVVALVQAFATILEAPLGEYDIAHLAYEIERVDLGLAGGRQDQYAAAFGGINFIEFLALDRVIVNPLRISDGIRNELESSIVVCFSGRSRSSAEIIDRQTAGMKSDNSKTIQAMHKLKGDAFDMKRALLTGDIDGMGEILNESWQAKKDSAEGVSNPLLDELFDLAMRNGALAGKVSGAGGGGFMFFFVHPENRYRLVSKLNETGAVSSPVKFTQQGCVSWSF